jgi:iron-sulfur cluster repair protein YtfE (RIC family)
MGHGADVIAELTADHREVDELFAQLDVQPVGDHSRRVIADELTAELERHAVVEEAFLYPAMREYVPDGKTLADKEIEDHRRTEGLLRELNGLGAGDDLFDDLVAKLRLEVAAHARDEEQRLFPLLTASCTPQTLADLGGQVREARRTALRGRRPTAQELPADMPLAPGAAPTDHALGPLNGRTD